ncbi:hypothetical protein Ocin01_14327 [Orchesella cincta]|uniref:Uncharacterized protein n=1 Tax=Orchesella cincta TaxID=48709 RepID=A0A1D2MHA2_ORCCI|nr:hypothetical protein Ocin01_14327 [Orchesella cincta]
MMCSASSSSDDEHQFMFSPVITRKPRHLGGFTIKDDAEDLLALPSDTNSAPVVVAPIDRNGPITTYAQQHTDNKAEESFGGGGGGNVNYQNPQGYQNQQQYQQQYQPPQRPTVLHPRPQGQGQNSQQISASASVQYPQAQLLQQQSQQQFSTIYQQPQQLQNLPNIHQPIMAQFSNPQVVAYSPGVGVGYHTALLDNNVPLLLLVLKLREAELYKAAIKNPLHLIDSVLKFFKQFAVPKEHYLNTISFAGIYLFMSILFYGSEDLLQLTCDSKSKSSEKEWHYHVGRRFVPGMQVDGKLQKKFLKLFEGMHLDDDGGDGSSSEEMSAELAGVNEVCPRAQKSPLDVYLLAKDLLYKHKIHPKIWYLGLVAAALERDDMTGFKVLVLFKIVHPIDAIPDWFIPAEYIKDEMESRSRSLLNRAKRDVENDNSTLTISSTSSTQQLLVLLLPQLVPKLQKLPKDLTQEDLTYAVQQLSDPSRVSGKWKR